MVEKKRDNNIDFFRGIAAICIIFIHTVFWSGTSYTSPGMKSLSLLIDVPIFIFISGMSFNYSNSVFKTIKGFTKLWLKYIVFVIFYFVLIFIFNNEHFSVSNVFKAMFFVYSGKDMFPAVSNSLWFMFMYLIVSLLGDIIVCTYNKFIKEIEPFKYILIVSFMFYGISLYKPEFTFIGPNIFMYLFIYLLGYYLYHFKLKNWKCFALLLTGWVCIYLVFILYMGLDFNSMQVYKFQYDMKYLVHSMLSILWLMFLKDRIKIKQDNVFVFIGKNALLFYFTQGISTSLMYYVLPYVNVGMWQLRLVIMFLINVAVTFVMTLFIKFIIDRLPDIKVDELILEKRC